MKKALVLLLALTLVSGFMFAEDEVVPRSNGLTLTGSGKATWGANFDNGATGFKNESELEIKIPLIDQASSTHGGDPITGEITLKDLSCAIDGDTAGWIDIGGGVEAKIKFPNSLYMTVFGAPGFELNNAQSLATLYNDGSWDDARAILKANIGAGPNDVKANGGIAFGMSGDFNFAIKLASFNNYTVTTGTDAGAATFDTFVATGTETSVTDVFNLNGTPATLPLVANALYIRRTAGAAAVPATSNTDNLYAAGLDIGYTIKDLASFAAGVEYGPFSDAGIMAFTVKSTVNPKDTGLTFVAALDGQSNDAVFGMDAMFTVDYTMTKLFSVGAGAYMGDTDTTSSGDMIFDARFRAALLAVENLTLEAAVDGWDLLNDHDPLLLFIDARLAYMVKQGDVNYVKPYAEIGYALTGSTANGGTLITKVGVEAKQFPRTVLTAEYKAGSFPADNTITSTNRAFSDDLGTFTLSAKVTY